MPIRIVANTQFISLSVFLLFSFTSCITAKKSIYFSDIKPVEFRIDSISREAARKIYGGDRITIQIITSDEEANKVFSRSVSSSNEREAGILVGSDGYIEVPVLGKFQVNGKTPTMVKQEVKMKLDELYKDGFVSCSLNGRIVVLSSLGGGVNSGGAVSTVPLTDERLTIPEVLSGVRVNNLKLNKTWIIREENGQRKIVKLNLNSSEIFKSKYYYLRNNDVIYFEPRKFNLFLESNASTRNIFSILAGMSGVVLAVVLAIK
jgi:polysaccharide export outer membrane protein